MNSRQEKKIYIFMKIRAQLADKRNMFPEVAHCRIYHMTLRESHHVLEHGYTGQFTANKHH